jgi:hypothetical protein
MKPILEIATAAKMAGFSIRHFRRILQQDRVRVIRIGRKFFITGNDFSDWARSKKLAVKET